MFIGEDLQVFFMTLLLDLLKDLISQKSETQLYQFAVSRVKEVGTRYLSAMKRALTDHPQLKVYLEKALQSTFTNSHPGGREGRISSNMSPPSSSQPSIQLKLDFSNFK